MHNQKKIIFFKNFAVILTFINPAPDECMDRYPLILNTKQLFYTAGLRL